MANITRNEQGKLDAYAWPGGYQIVYYTEDGGTLCPACANGENESDAHEDNDDPQWKLVAADLYQEGPTIQCDHCGADIESDYGDPDAEDDEPTEPEESDITTKDHERFYQDGKLVLFRMANGRTWRYWAGSDKGERPLGSFDTCEAALRAYMDRVQFWPNVWFISDHGNAHLMDLGDSE